ncbi:MAG: polyprenyl synthetase family protein [Alphaproteobacteria bacterium]
MQAAAGEVEAALDMLLPKPMGPEAQLFEAMRYAALGGGKRLRPFLTIQCGRLFDVGAAQLHQVAGAVECVHVYSLVHDDLPAMDDDDIRRGKPTVHKQFDEATAILAGNALLTLAFQILSRPDTHADPFVRCELVTRLAAAAGGRGMIGGQMMDLQAGEYEHTIEAITRLQRLKTGALVAFSCEAGGLMAKASPKAMHALNAYAHDLGLAFQIADDLLDVEGNAERMGKGARKDKAADKATFVEILGVERARDQARRLADQATRHLDMFDERAELLRAVAEFAVARDH